MTSGLIGNIATNAVYFFFYKMWQDIFKKYFPSLKEGEVLFSMLTSLLAAAMNVIITNPIWVLNSRMTQSKDNVIKIKFS